MTDDNAVAIVGVGCRYPGAAGPDAFWRVLAGGEEPISRFDPAQLAGAGVPAALARDPRYVPARGVIRDADRFDWAYFGYSPAEAGRTDPQQRVFLETAAAALDDAGVDPTRFPGWIGVFAGADLAVATLAPGDAADPDLVARVIGSEKDFLATRVAYKLRLRGPAISVQTACSTSLVATHVAAGSLLNHECDLALAGGVCVIMPQQAGYLYTEGHILSRDGHCRAFDAAASGTVPSNGCGVVVLRRLADARRDRDRILAVLRGSAVNNDGGEKVGYTAPSFAGQRDVIRLALAQADVDPADVGYVEAHGTGTALGDPVEVAALTAAFQEAGSTRTGWCRLGSVKSNVGHTGAASGVAGLIKAALQLSHRELVPTLHVDRPNPELELATSPFRLSLRREPWPADGPALAGVSSFGIGGTNAHAVLEAAPERPAGRTRGGPALFLVSAASPEAGRQLRNELAAVGTAVDPTDAAWTLATGRRRHRYRWSSVAGDLAAATADEREPVDAAVPPVLAFLFPGQGTLTAGAAGPPYRLLPGFRRAYHELAGTAADRYGVDLHLLRRADLDPAWLADTVHQQLGLFAVGYALAEQLRAWGARPAAMVGHSVGEYVAATLAGRWSVADGLAIVYARAAAMRATAPGRMVVVAREPDDVADLLAEHPEVALAVAAPGRVVLSGPVEAIERLAAAGVSGRPLPVERAFHSPLMRPAAEAVRRAVAELPDGGFGLPVISTLTGQPLSEAGPDYWAEQLLGTVRLDAAMASLLSRSGCDGFVELGAGSMIGPLRRHPSWRPGRLALSMLGTAPEHARAHLLGAVGRLWEAGVEVAVEDLWEEDLWEEDLREEDLREAAAPARVALPPHPFVPRECPAQAPALTGPPAASEGGLTVPTWRPVASDRAGRFARLAVLGDVPDGLTGLLSPDPYPVATPAEAAAAGAVAVRYPGPAVPDIDALDDLAGRCRGEVLVLTTGMVDLAGGTGEPADLVAWVEHRRRTGPVRLMDVPPGSAPAAPPAPAPDCAVLVHRGGRWWGRAAMRVRVPAVMPERRYTVATRGLPAGAELAAELAAAGLRVAGYDGPPVTRSPAPTARLAGDGAGDPTGRLSGRPDLLARLDSYCAGLAARYAPADPAATRLPRLAGALRAIVAAERADGVAERADGVTEGQAGAAEKLDEVAGLRRLLDHAASSYPDVFAGRRDPLSVLYPDGDPRLLDDCLRGNQVAVTDAEPCLRGLAEAVRAAAAARPAGEPLRVLEIGAGQGVFTWELLDGWRDRTGLRYHVTDISPLLVRRARAEAERRGLAGMMRFSTFDITRDPVPQGLAAGTYDVVIGYNVVHVAPSIRDAVGHLTLLLRPGGWLGLVELTRVPRWANLIWGLAPGWWDFADDLREDSVHLDLPSWARVLADAGLRVSSADAGDHALLVAERQEAAEADGEILCVADPAELRLPAGAPGIVVTIDPAGWRGQRARHRIDPEWRHIEVPAATPELLAALVPYVDSPGLPPVARLDAPATPPSPPPAATAATGPAVTAPPAGREPGGDTGDPVTPALRRLWCETLGVPSVTDADDFFQLGGESLMVVELLARVRDQLGVQVAVPAFVPAATFGALRGLVAAGRTAGRGARPASGVIAFREGGTRPPLFLAPPGAGTSLCYRRLADLLGDDQPCFGLESPTNPPLRDLAEIAAHHVRQLRETRPGPYLLGGWSIGAVVAHEMAAQLHEAGERVERIICIDGFVPDTGGRPLGTLPGYLARGLWYRAVAASGLDRNLPPGAGPVYHASIAAMLGYRPRHVPCGAVLFKARLTPARARRLGRALRPMYDDELVIRPAKGSHWTVLSAGNVEHLADGLRRALTDHAGTCPATRSEPESRRRESEGTPRD